MMYRSNACKRRTAWVLIMTVVLPLFAPYRALALTSGPNSPEFSSFEPVATTNMVNEFTGDFTYNLPVIEIPGPEGSGYALSLSYHSGISPEEEASWVGDGFTLSPGAITRNTRGFPDDCNGKKATFFNDVPANWTVSMGGHVGNIEAFSVDVPLNFNASIRYNSYKGWGYTAGVGFSVKGMASLGFALSDEEEGHFTYSVNPAALMSHLSQEAKKDATALKDQQKSSWKPKALRYGQAAAGMTGQMLIGSQCGYYSQNWVSRATKTDRYTGTSVNVTASLEPTECVPVGPEAGIFGGITLQKNDPSEEIPVFGYMYAGNANHKSVQDYYLEHESPYQKRDKFLAIPFSNPDYFAVTGEGLSGGFRARQRKAGHFYPNQVISPTAIATVGLEFQAGGNVGVGADGIEVGAHTLEVDKWAGYEPPYSFEPSTSTQDEPFFFRFKNDLGGNALFGNSTAAEAPAVVNQAPSVSAFAPDMSFEPYNRVQKSGRTGRASYIGFHTHHEMQRLVGGSTLKKAYTKDADALGFVVDTTDIGDGIGEFIMTNEDGFTYTFGLPVYARNEENLHYGLKELSSVNNNYIAYGALSSGNIRSKVGEKRPAPYATMHLLTGITSPDYIDRQQDGPTPDDFGSFTKFTYQQVHGTSVNKSTDGNWYHWRMPYTGFFYNRNSLSDLKDDQCAYLSGEKEVYYLSTISTKTHQAIFYTSDRGDGLEAPDNSTAANDATAMGTNKLKQLDSIQLFALDPAQINAPRLLQTVHFGYAYELMPGAPNADPGLNPAKAKLTLKRVWTDYEGTIPAKIAPYEFEYQYTASGYPAPYLGLDDFGGFASADENPSYEPTNLDAWGSYQKDGGPRMLNLKTWINQTPDAAHFDPAAWQLKKIRLPSGGSIDVQYEADDYEFVQNRRALAMVSLGSLSDDTNKCYLNVGDLGINPTAPYNLDPELNKLKYLIEKELIAKDEKIYFKFLYSLLSPCVPALDNYNSDYISGYAKIQEVDIDPNGLYIKLGGTTTFPHIRSVCKNFVKTSRGGMLSAGDCAPSASGLDASLGPEDLALQLIGFIGTTFAGNSLNCQQFNPGLSYLRIPVLHPKKGGGVRVKRVLMFDQGLNGKAVLLGNEYLYETKDPLTGEIISSGVATNEPDRIREENALITNLEKRKDQGYFERIFAGKDHQEFEGFVGESLLPGAAVGYSRVIVKNIHSGKTNPGFAIKEFFTSYDHPFDETHPWLGGQAGVSMTEINEGDKEWEIIPAGISSFSKTNLWLTQGFSFIQTDFEGKPKGSATYAGPYSKIHDPDASALISSEQFNYFYPGEPIPISLGLDYSSQTVLKSPGKEMELIFETKKIIDISADGSLEGDASLCILPVPIPFVSAFASLNYAESKLYTEVATKITEYPAVVKSVERFQDGLYTRTENLAFSPDNCRPVLTRTTDGFHGLNLEQSAAHKGYYWNYDFSAASIYSALGQRALNEKRVLTSGGFEKQQFGTDYKLVATSTGAVQEMDFLTSGDLVELQGMGVYHIGKRTGNLLDLHPFSLVAANAATGVVPKIEVLTSGQANRLNESTGNLTVYGGDIEVVDNSIDPTELANRQAFANYLNLALQGIVGQLYSFPGTTSIDYPGWGCNTCPFTNVTKLQDNYSGSILESSEIIIACAAHPYCRMNVPRSSLPVFDHFGVNAGTGALEYFLGSSPNRPIEGTFCQFCPIFKTEQTVAGVIDVNISTYHDDWALPADQLPVYKISDPNISPYELGFKGKWRPNANYVYRESIIPGMDKPGAATTNRIYKDAGTFTMVMFNWDNIFSNDPAKWLKVNQTNRYSPYGQALEEQDIRNVKSVAKYGYSHSLPYLLGQNTDFGSVCFESFENIYNNSLVAGGKAWEEAVPVDLLSATPDAQVAHAGRQSLRLKVFQDLPGNYSPYSKFYYKNIIATPQLLGQGLRVKFWLKAKNKYGYSLIHTLLKLTAGTVLEKQCVKVAQTGDWSLYEAAVTPADFATAGITTGTIMGVNLRFELDPSQIGNSGISGPFPDWYDELWLDDLRIQPADAQMVCYVYDPATYRLLTSFDDQHFGLYYQYNAQGELVRKLVETEKGLKTVQETQYHSPLKPRQ